MRPQGLLKRMFADNAGIGHCWKSKQHFFYGSALRYFVVKFTSYCLFMQAQIVTACKYFFVLGVLEGLINGGLYIWDGFNYHGLKKSVSRQAIIKGDQNYSL